MSLLVAKASAPPIMPVALRKAYPFANNDYNEVIQCRGINVMAGDLIIVAYAVGNSAQPTTCVDDNTQGGPNLYTRYGSGGNFAPGGVSIQLFYAKAKAAATLNLTVTGYSGNDNYPDVIVHVVKGITASVATVLDSAAFDTVEGAAAKTHTSAQVSSTYNGTLYAFCFWSQQWTSDLFVENGTGFSLRTQQASPHFSASFDKIIVNDGSTITIQDLVTTTNSLYCGNVLAVFRAT